jgi:hypothetical protein
MIGTPFITLPYRDFAIAKRVQEDHVGNSDVKSLSRNRCAKIDESHCPQLVVMRRGRTVPAFVGA